MEFDGVILAGVPCGHYKQSGLSTKNVCVLCFCVVFLGFCVFVCCVCFCSWFLRRKAPLFFFCLSAPFPFSPLIFTFFSSAWLNFPAHFPKLIFPLLLQHRTAQQSHQQATPKRPPSKPAIRIMPPPTPPVFSKGEHKTFPSWS